jgi:Zn-dependent protease with chaperone function
MTGTLLFAYAALLAGPVAWTLRRAGWFGRAPVLGVLAWQVLSTSVLLAVVLGAVAMIPAADDHHDHNRHFLAVEACSAAVVILIVVLVGLGRGLVGHLIHGVAERRRHRSLLGLVGRQDDQLGAVVIDHETVAAYCVPGRDRRIVLTTAALRVLDDAQLTAVLAHERAHLRGRHHLVVAPGRVFRLAFPFVPGFRWAHDEVGRLVEMLADDAAARGCERRALAGALVALAGEQHPSPVPRAAFGIARQAVTGRVRRLLGPGRPLARWAVTLWGIALFALLAVPIIAAAPAVALTDGALSHCPFV